MNTEFNKKNLVANATVETEMQKSYLDYAMSVIVSRALPDCRDGLKPVHRRIVYAMGDTGNNYDKPYRKSARVVGEVMGKYHPHGDSAIYSSLARMTQPFSLKVPLLDGQGNFGSVDGDEPAQMRYTEVRLAKVSNHGLLADIEKDTVDFNDNYDSSEKEPSVLPARFPNLLVNGANGIAVGMATNIPTFNLGEVIDACCAYLDNEQITMQEILEYLPGPDFPTGGEILGHERIKNAMMTGHGGIIMRGSVKLDAKNRVITITDLPYQVNKSDLVRNIELLGRDKIIDGISEVRDESNKLGISIIIELKKEAEAEVVLNQIYKNTQLETSFGMNMLALHEGQPKVMNCLFVISAFIKFREEVIIRRTSYLLRKAQDRSHILVGLLIAIQNIDEIVALIKSSNDSQDAKTKLCSLWWNADSALKIMILINDSRNLLQDQKSRLTPEQAQAILDMRLHRLTGLESSKIVSELEQLVKEIQEYMQILELREVLLNVIRKELIEIKENFATPRRTAIVHSKYDIADEDLIPQEDMVVIVTRGGYIKRTHLSQYREQKRGGRGKSSITTHEDDAVTDLMIATTHHYILFFSDKGKVYRLKVYKLPLGTAQSKGRAMVNLLPLADGEKITSIMTLGSEDFAIHKNEQGEVIHDEKTKYLIFATSNGSARRNLISDFSNIPTNGKIAIRLENDKLIGVALCNQRDHILLATKQGKAIRFPVSAIRVFRGRTSNGVRAVRLSRNNDSVISLSILWGREVASEVRDSYLKIPVEERIKLSYKLRTDQTEKAELFVAKLAQKLENIVMQSVLPVATESRLAPLDIATVIELAKHEQFILTVTSKGFGKKTSAYEYRVTGRGGQGVSNVELTSRNGEVVAAFPVQRDDAIMVVTDNGTMIRISVKNIRITGRGAIGVKVIDVQGKDSVSSISKVVETDKNPEDDDNDDENLETKNNNASNCSYNENDIIIENTVDPDSPDLNIKSSNDIEASEYDDFSRDDSDLERSNEDPEI